jgi:hypothetical protein
VTYAVCGAVATAVSIGFAVFLIRQGLDNADKISSVISMVVGVLALLLTIWSIREARRARRREAAAGRTAGAGPRDSTPGRVGSSISIDKIENAGTIVNGDRNVIGVSARRRDAQGK